MAALILLLVLGLVFGLILGIADKFFKVELDERVDRINNLLPQFNCGACGFPGCLGLASAIVEEKARVSDCKPIKADKKEVIYEYITNAIGANGEVIDILKVK
ncbi:MAG: RnfABCDGE type electron transport complex subunit B [Bacilli bacterium]